MTWPFTITDEQAMWRVQNADDHAAFARLVERWETPIQRLCARMTGDLHRAEDQPEQSYSERQIYEAAIGRLARELAAMENIDEPAAQLKIEQVLKAA